PRVEGGGERRGAGGETGPQPPVTHESSQRVRQEVGGSGRNEQPAGAVLDEVGQTTGGGAYDGQAEGGRLHERDRQALLAGGQREHVGRAHQAEGVAAETEEPEAVAEAEAAVDLLELLAARTVSDRQEQHVG